MCDFFSFRELPQQHTSSRDIKVNKSALRPRRAHFLVPFSLLPPHADNTEIKLDKSIAMMWKSRPDLKDPILVGLFIHWLFKVCCAAVDPDRKVGVQ